MHFSIKSIDFIFCEGVFVKPKMETPRREEGEARGSMARRMLAQR
jgi:hypothetical protein